jgi:hypothetical protein
LTNQWLKIPENDYPKRADVSNQLMAIVVAVESLLPDSFSYDWGGPVYSILNWRVSCQHIPVYRQAYTQNFATISSGSMPQLDAQLRGLNRNTLFCILSAQAWGHVPKVVEKSRQEIFSEMREKIEEAKGYSLVSDSNRNYFAL